MMSVEDAIYPLLSAYTKAPQWVKSAVGGVYSAIPLSWRRGAAYGQFRNVLADHDAIRVSNYARHQLGETLRWAVTSVPAYRGLASVEDCLRQPEQVLAAMPLVSKSEIKADLSRYLSDAMPVSARLKTFTGGSTSEPMMFYLHKGVTRAREYAFMDDFHARVGLADQDVMLALRGRTVPSAGKPGGRLWMYEPIKRQLILSSDHLEPEFMPEYIGALRKWRPTFIDAFPSAIYPLARWLEEHPEPDVTGCIKGVLLYSENVYGYQMELLRRVFTCPVLKHYGHSERVLMAASMPDDERCFFWPQYGRVELVDEHKESITEPNVLGEIVGTSFDNRVMPFVRYRTGDMAMWSEKPGHPALPGYPVVERIEGRLQEFLVCRDHRLISICTMGAAHFDELASVDVIQYEQRVPGHFMLKVVTASPLHEEAKARIQRAVLEKTQGGCSAEVVEVQEIPRTVSGKHRMLVQHLDIGSYLWADKCK
jgi:phenylacetate-CoA ligase